MRNFKKHFFAATALVAAASLNVQAHGHGHGNEAPKGECPCPQAAPTDYQDRVVSFAHDHIRLINPKARKAQKGQNSAAYVKVENTNNKAQKIVKAHSPVANVIELHTSFEENGVHKMRPVEAIEAPAKGSVELKSGGYHVMLIDLKHDLVVGQEIPVILELENGGKIEATYAVKGCCGHCHGPKK